MGTTMRISDRAKKELERMMQAYALPELAIVITVDAKTEHFIGRLVDARILHPLKTKYIGVIEPGIHVYTFGIGTLPPDMVFEFNVMPAHGFTTRVTAAEEKRYLLSVVAKPPKSLAPEPA